MGDLLCHRCRHLVTRSGDRIAPFGQHTWCRTNPGGWVYHFGCFARAPGCVSRGVPSRQATWFEGWFWHVQVCAACSEHLGWLFFRDEGAFYALITDRLVPGGSAAAS